MAPLMTPLMPTTASNLFHATLNSLRLPFSRWVLAGSVLATFILLALLVWGVQIGLNLLPIAHDSWLGKLADIGGVALGLILGWFLFPALVTGVSGLFLESLADRIEQSQYQGLPAARTVGLAEQISTSARLLLRAVGLNLLALPFYFIPVVNVIIYLIINANLLGREYFTTIALRHRNAAACQQLLGAHQRQIRRLGLLIALLGLVPVVNLLLPIIATALMTHTLWKMPDGALRK